MTYNEFEDSVYELVNEWFDDRGWVNSSIEEFNDWPTDEASDILHTVIKRTIHDMYNDCIKHIDSAVRRFDKRFAKLER